MGKKAKTTRGKKPAPSGRAATSTPIGRQNVILERIEEQQRVVIEAVTMNREALERRIDSLADKHRAKADASRVSALEGRVEILENPGAP